MLAEGADHPPAFGGRRPDAAAPGRVTATPNRAAHLLLHPDSASGALSRKLTGGASPPEAPFCVRGPSQPHPDPWHPSVSGYVGCPPQMSTGLWMFRLEALAVTLRRYRA